MNREAVIILATVGTAVTTAMQAIHDTATRAAVMTITTAVVTWLQRKHVFSKRSVEEHVLEAAIQVVEKVNAK